MTRFPWAPLEALLRASLRPELNGAGQPASLTRRMSEVLGCDPAQIARWRRYGLLQEQADRLAVALGLHPACVWPAWGTDALRQRCPRRLRRWRRSRRGRESHRLAKARWRASCPGYEARMQRARRAANPLRKREEDRLYRERNREAINARRREARRSTKNKDNAHKVIAATSTSTGYKDVTRNVGKNGDTPDSFDIKGWPVQNEPEIPAQCHAFPTGSPRNAVSDAAHDGAMSEQEVA